MGNLFCNKFFSLSLLTVILNDTIINNIYFIQTGFLSYSNIITDSNYS